MSVAEILKAINQGESVKIEFKKSFDRETIETIVAFANTIGGSVFIGIDDTGKIIGTNLRKETVQNWLNQFKTATQPSILPEIEEHSIQNKKIVEISIIDYPIKPICTNGKFFKRIKNSNHKMDISEITNLHLKTFNTSWDYYENTDHKIESISLTKVNKFIDLANKNKNNPINDDPITVLKKFELVKNGSITNACYLLFMEKDSLLSDIEIGRFSEETVIKDNLSLQCDLFSEVNQTLEFIKKHINKSYIINGSLQRIERWDYPLDAIREVIMNMITHRDYLHSSSSIIKIFDERIEFFNPGKLPDFLKVENLLSGNYTSSIRNKQIAMLFKEAGLIEKYGSGIRRVFESCHNYGLRPPKLEEFQHGFRVTVYNEQKYLNN